MNGLPEVKFNVDDEVQISGGEIAFVIVVYREESRALVRYGDGARAFVPLAELSLFNRTR